MYLKLAEEVAEYLDLFCFEKWKTEQHRTNVGQLDQSPMGNIYDCFWR